MGSGTGCTAISSVAIGRGGTMGLIIALQKNEASARPPRWRRLALRKATRSDERSLPRSFGSALA
jgi:hypothetical protein